MMRTHPTVRALLISNSTNHGQDYLDHVEDAITGFLGDIKKIYFVPYASRHWDAYTEKARARFNAMGIDLVSVHAVSFRGRDILTAADEQWGIFVGGGNTFRLLHHIQQRNLINLIGAAVLQGAPYIGASAGANLACPTIGTTNDMPIMHPISLFGLGIVPYQINPHYLDPDVNLLHMGETRDTRIREFHEENDTPVVGLREGSWIHVESGMSALHGPHHAKLFLKDREPLEISDGSTIEATISFI